MVLGAKLHERHPVSVRVSVTDQGVWDREIVKPRGLQHPRSSESVAQESASSALFGDAGHYPPGLWREGMWCARSASLAIRTAVRCDLQFVKNLSWQNATPDKVCYSTEYVSYTCT